MTGLAKPPKAVAWAKALVGVQLMTLFCCGVVSIGFWVPAFLLMTNIAAASSFGVGGSYQWLALLPWAVEPGVAGAWVLFASHLLNKLNKRDRRGRTAVDIGTATLVALALAAFVVTAFEVAGIGWYSWLALLSAAPSIGLHVAASLCLRTESAKAWLREPQTPKATALAGEQRRSWLRSDSAEAPHVHTGFGEKGDH